MFKKIEPLPPFLFEKHPNAFFTLYKNSHTHVFVRLHLLRLPEPCPSPVYRPASRALRGPLPGQKGGLHRQRHAWNAGALYQHQHRYPRTCPSHAACTTYVYFVATQLPRRRNRRRPKGDAVFRTTKMFDQRLYHHAVHGHHDIPNHDVLFRVAHGVPTDTDRGARRRRRRRRRWISLFCDWCRQAMARGGKRRRAHH